ncbi:lysozyme inhibitor LprI family protein [Rhizobium sp. TRM95111]|nr:lysozyme inhibitor LprI family protein [Rhizobium alarense]MCF3640915.1 lysozyme inhibitor LprI family protein [Rhizobium alarense]
MLCVLAGAVLAQDAEPEIDCENAMAQQDMNYCAGKDFEAADAELNAAYKQAMAAMRETDRELGEISKTYVGAVEALKKAQRAWIGYRDGECELAGFDARGGSMEPMLVSGCRAEMTRKRTVELKALYQNDGN